MPLHGTFATCPDETCWDVQFDRFGVKAGRRLALGRQVFMFSPAGRSAGRPGRSLCGLPIDMAAAQRDDIVDGARAALVRLDNDRSHARTHVGGHRVYKVGIQGLHHDIAAKPRRRTECRPERHSGRAADQPDQRTGHRPDHCSQQMTVLALQQCDLPRASFLIITPVLSLKSAMPASFKPLIALAASTLRSLARHRGRIAQATCFKKDRSGQQPVNSGQNHRIENSDHFGQPSDRRNINADRIESALVRRRRFNIDSGSPVFVRGAFGPAPERMPEGGCVADPQRECDILDRQIGIADVLDRRMRPQFVDQFAKRGALLFELSPERTRALFEASCNQIEARGLAHAGNKHLANPACQTGAQLQLTQQPVAERGNFGTLRDSTTIAILTTG